MKVLKFFFVLLFSLSFKINANNLINHLDHLNLIENLNEFFKKKYSLDQHYFKVIIRTPLRKNLICKKPHFLSSSNFYHSGLFDILYICKNQHQHLKVELQIKGEYIIAKRKIPHGTKISASDLTTIIGRLDNLPNGTYLHKKDVINRVNLRDILPFQPITSFMTRVFWAVKFNQLVTIKVHGINFDIITSGKALSNGGIEEKIRVRMKNGKIITGKVNKNGEVIVVL